VAAGTDCLPPSEVKDTERITSTQARGNRHSVNHSVTLSRGVTVTYATQHNARCAKRSGAKARLIVEGEPGARDVPAPVSPLAVLRSEFSVVSPRGDPS
jgi:hypothetical protein